MKTSKVGKGFQPNWMCEALENFTVLGRFGLVERTIRKGDVFTCPPRLLWRVPKWARKLRRFLPITASTVATRGTATYSEHYRYVDAQNVKMIKWREPMTYHKEVHSRVRDAVDARTRSLQTLKDSIDGGKHDCVHCRWYRDPRLKKKCWLKWSQRGGCNMWELSPKLKEEFKLYELT